MISERFWAKTQPQDGRGCIRWTGAHSKDGYGRFALRRVNTKAHRVAWMLDRGPIPDGLCVLHRCDVRDCVNVDHLFLGTIRDNNTDARMKGRLKRTGKPNRNQDKTSCVHGHAYTESNTYKLLVRGKWYRSCRTCRKRHAAEASARRRAR